jgi:hypothetical protein
LAGCDGLTAFGRTSGAAPGPPGTWVLTAGLIEALGGSGALPCWIRDARCCTDGGSVAPAPAPAAPPAGAFEPPGPAGGGWLMTLLITVVLWMLLKITLFGGGAT